MDVCFHPIPVVEIENIGGRLKAAREAAGFTVDDVVFKTQLPRSVVIALEAEDFQAFTSPLYARSFLSQYSDFLNVDAQPWIEALQPGGFMSGGDLQPVVASCDAPLVSKDPATETRGGTWSILGLLVLSAAVVFAAIQGYDSFEARFGREPAARADDSPPPPAPPRVKLPVETQPSVAKEDEELGKPPPRAIIVR